MRCPGRASLLGIALVAACTPFDPFDEDTLGGADETSAATGSESESDGGSSGSPPPSTTATDDGDETPSSGSDADEGESTTAPADTGSDGESGDGGSSSSADDTTSTGADACADGRLGDGETDVDCGGVCAPCTNGFACAQNDDCEAGICQNSVCGASCDPLLQDCADGEGCYPGHENYFCATDVSGVGGVPGDPCDAPGDCNPGALCVPQARVPDCGGRQCCTFYCDLSDPDADATCTGTSSCVADELAAAPNIGICLDR
jgi:hypothetical protein